MVSGVGCEDLLFVGDANVHLRVVHERWVTDATYTVAGVGLLPDLGLVGLIV